MKPALDVTLGRLAGRLRTEVAPHVTDAYAASSLEVTSMLMAVAAAEADRAAAVRVEENRDLRRLFDEASRVLPAGELQRELASAAAETDEDLRISALDEANAGLRRLLIALHETVEAGGENRARELDARVWELLQRIAERRAFELPESALTG